MFICGGGGGAQKNMCEHAHHERQPRSPLRALEALGYFDALSCYPSLSFKYSDTKWAKKHSQSNFRGGGMLRPL